jgi:hypothetical protein
MTCPSAVPTSVREEGQRNDRHYSSKQQFRVAEIRTSQALGCVNVGKQIGKIDDDSDSNLYSCHADREADRDNSSESTPLGCLDARAPRSKRRSLMPRVTVARVTNIYPSYTKVQS